MAGSQNDYLWTLAHAERAALAEDLAGLEPAQWRHDTLCGDWDVEQAAPSRHTPAYLGEIVVHAQDIRRPLGLTATPSLDALTPVADFFARRNFAVPSHTHAADLQLRADDGPLATGNGPLVSGSTLALVMGMAGRVAYLAELAGPGVQTLRSRLQAAASRFSDSPE